MFQKTIIKFLTLRSYDENKNQNEVCKECCHLVIHRTSLKSNNTCNADKTTSSYVICDWCFRDFVMLTPTLN